GSGLALNENGTVQARDRLDQLEDPFHCAPGADDVLEAVLFVELFAQILVFEAKLALSKPFADHQREFEQFEWLGQIVIGALLNSGDSGFYGSVTSNDEPDDFRIPHKRLFE